MFEKLDYGCKSFVEAFKQRRWIFFLHQEIAFIVKYYSCNSNFFPDIFECCEQYTLADFFQVKIGSYRYAMKASNVSVNEL